MKKLSIIIPVFNVEKYISDCLDSIICQDINKEDYEIICINDGSTDNSENILNSYAEKHTNIKVIHKENGGVSSARNVGIDNSSGKYIWFVDSDDFISRTSLTYIIKAIDKYNPEFIKFFYKHVNENISYTDCWKNDFQTIQANILTGHAPGSNVCTIVSAQIIKENNIKFRTDMKYGEDILFSYYTFINSKGLRYIQFNNCFYYYRDRESSAMNTRTPEIYTRRTHDLLLMSKIYKDAFDNKITDNPNLLENTKRRQYQALLGALTILPRSTLDFNKTIKALKEEGLYPFPWIWWHARSKQTKKEKLIEGLKIFFKFKPIFRIYYIITKK